MKRLLIVGPSFRRNPSEEMLPAVDRYDGLFFRVTRKYTRNREDVDIVVMLGDLTLVNGTTLIPFSSPEGKEWKGSRLPTETIMRAKTKNKGFLENRLGSGEYSEIFVAMGQEYAKALPELSQSGVRIVFPKTGGPGPKAAALRDWLWKVK